MYDKVNLPKRLQDCMLPGELERHMDEQVQWPGDKMFCPMIGLQTWYQTIKNLHLYDASKYDFASLKNNLISTNLAVLERTFLYNYFNNNDIFSNESEEPLYSDRLYIFLSCMDFFQDISLIYLSQIYLYYTRVVRSPLKRTKIIIFNLFYHQVESQLLRKKCMFKH